MNAPERPIIQGKIVEVDIRDEQSRASGAGRAPSPKRQRIGPDGKPWRSRNRRGSDDVKRDQLVDDFLHENKRTSFKATNLVTIKVNQAC